MNRTPEEIAQQLRQPLPIHYHSDPEPRLTPLKVREINHLHLEASECIDSLLTDRQYLKDAADTFMEECRKYEEKYLALLADIQSVQGCICIICKHYVNPERGMNKAKCAKFGNFSDIGSDGALTCGQFEWRGVQKGKTYEGID